MRNFKITISYDGTDFHGWQTQPDCRTVQETLETALRTVTGEKVFANASGRTDAGVHALGQVVNFHSASRLSPWTMVNALNANLPQDVAVRDAVEVDLSFDANRQAVRKHYRYVILDGPVRSPFMRCYAMRSRHPLQVAAMAEAARCLVGTHDFHSFETEWPNRSTSIRTITHLTVSRVAEFLWIDVEADGFLYNMVRSIAGTLVNVGRGFWPIEKVAEILAANDRCRAGQTAPAEGLYLVRVHY